MAFCRNCGTELPEEGAFCPNCGAAVQQQNEARGNSFSDTINDLNNTPDTTAEFDPADIEANKILSLFSYLGILFLIPLLAAKDSKYARFHANQGIVLFIFSIAVNLFRYIPYIGGILGGIGSLLTFVLAIIGIVNAVNGKAKELPVIGKIKLLK